MQGSLDLVHVKWELAVNVGLRANNVNALAQVHGHPSKPKTKGR